MHDLVISRSFAQQLAMDGQFLRQPAIAEFFGRVAVEVREHHVLRAADQQARIPGAASADEHAVLTDAHAHVPEDAGDKPFGGQNPARVSHFDPSAVDVSLPGGQFKAHEG